MAVSISHDSDAAPHDLVTADVSCNFITGVATGTGAETCVHPTGVCNGIKDDTTAFNAFNSWARRWQARNTGLIELVLPTGSNCRLNTHGTPFAGIKRLRVIGYGAILGGNYFHLAGLGQFNDNRHSARFQTADAGSLFVTLTNSSQTSLFTVGQYVQVTGFDLQGYGYPTNPHWWEYQRVTAKDGACQGTGTVCFSAPLKFTYKSTWPAYNGGASSGQVDMGGPGTLYALPSSWDTDVEWRGVTFTKSAEIDAVGRQVTFRDTTWTGNGTNTCLFPTQNFFMGVYNSTMTNCQMEVDKLNQTFVFSGSSINVIFLQSTGINDFRIENSNVSVLIGSGRKMTVADSTIDKWNPGPAFFGRTDEIVCLNTAVNSMITPQGNIGQLYPGSNNQGLESIGTMSGGVFTFPSGSGVTGFANNGSDAVRLTVHSTDGFITGKRMIPAGVFASGGSGAGIDGSFQINVIDSTHVDLVGSTFSTTTWSRGGALINKPPQWATPGVNLFWADETSRRPWSHAFQVTNVTQDSVNTYVTTTLSGGFPPIPTTGTTHWVLVHPAPKFTATNCRGEQEFASTSLAPAGAPIWSYQQYTFTGSIGVAAQGKFPLWGNLMQISANVTNAYTGARNVSFNIGSNYSLVLSNNKQFNYNATVNVKSVGDRQVTLSGFTCVSGTCAGDSGLAAPDSTLSYFTGPPLTSGPFYSSDVSSSCPGAGCPSVTVTFQTNQGVVIPPQ
jgi:hypothetical protein